MKITKVTFLYTKSDQPVLLGREEKYLGMWKPNTTQFVTDAPWTFISETNIF
jgi:hypothetical protein